MRPILIFVYNRNAQNYNPDKQLKINDVKKIYILFFLLTLALTINANPIPIPTIEISELCFDESGKWKLELEYFYINPDGYTFDSIFIFSSMDTAKVADFLLTGQIGQFVLTADSLTADFRINRLGD